MQSASEKHKINVPETMNEFLDMSDDEGTVKILFITKCKVNIGSIQMIV